MSHLEAELDLQIRGARLTRPMREWPFHEGRRWRFDRAWPARRIAVEVEGGIWARLAGPGRHTRPSGFERDCEKYNQAALDGWLVLRVTERMITSGLALRQIEAALAARPLDDRPLDDAYAEQFAKAVVRFAALHVRSRAGV